MSTLKHELAHIPQHILQELTKCSLPVTGYHPHINPPQSTYIPITTAHLNNNQTSQLKLITWNAGCINSSLPGILNLTQKLHKDPHIILIQETKIHKLKSTTYIDKKFQTTKLYITTRITSHKYQIDIPKTTKLEEERSL